MPDVAEVAGPSATVEPPDLLRRILVFVSVLMLVVLVGLGAVFTRDRILGRHHLTGTLTVTAAIGAPSVAQPRVGQPCGSDQRFGDIHTGTKLSVTNGARLLGSGTIPAGVGVVGPTTGLRATACQFKLDVSNIAKATGYSVTASGRTIAIYTPAQLDQRHWKLALTGNN